MDTQIRHPMLVNADHDENFRQQFVHNLRLTLASNILPGNKSIYEARVKPTFKKKHKREPKNRHEIRQAMNEDPFYRLYCATQRASQEMMWDSVIDSVEREKVNLNKQATSSTKLTNGSCTTNNKFEVPTYHTAADIHLQPGGYHWEQNETDICAGAIYDRSVFIYAIGGLGDMNDDLGKTLVNYFQKNYPKIQPLKILDIGCSVGHSTLPWVDAFPSAEVHGIDCGGGMVRYAHARAQHLGKTVHYSQQNAEQTNFPDNTFDIICSHIVLHETSTSAFRNILKENYRILKPGGIMLHLDAAPPDEGMELFHSFMYDWEAYNNNETFLVRQRDMDWESGATIAGFKKDQVNLDASTTYLAQKAILEGKEPAYAGAFPILIGIK